MQKHSDFISLTISGYWWFLGEDVLVTWFCLHTVLSLIFPLFLLTQVFMSCETTTILPQSIWESQVRK